MLVSDLRIGQQQIVEIAKALSQDVRVLIMDEPTSALSAAEVEVLFKVIDDLRKAHGVSIIYISHKLEEITQIGDYITVLRDGKLVAEERIARDRRALDHREDGRQESRQRSSTRKRWMSAARSCASRI